MGDVYCPFSIKYYEITHNSKGLKLCDLPPQNKITLQGELINANECFSFLLAFLESELFCVDFL